MNSAAEQQVTGLSYRFDDFSFDPDIGLSRSGEAIPLEPLAHELLHYLLRNRGRVVSRDELNQDLWSGRIVSDAALSTQIRSVRRALGDDRAQQRYIKTYPRRGFSFVAPVQIVGETDVAATAGVTQYRNVRVSKWLAAAAVLILAIVAVVLWTGRDTDEVVSEEPPSLSIAVLPFENLSGDPSRDYLADAFTEDLITDLSRIRDAFVISRSTTFTYRGKDVDAPTVAADLGVRYVLEGSLRVDGDNVRINAQLIDGQSNSHIWSRRYDGEFANLFDIQDNVTGRIASVLRAELRMAENERQDPNATKDAWDYALRGNVILYNHQSLSDYQEAYALLSKAVSLDPTISSAWGGLAFIHYVGSLAKIDDISQPNSAELSLDAAQRAVQADPMNAEPYWLVGAGFARIGQPEKGMAACRTAMELNPNMDCGHVCAGLVHMAEGEPEKAIPYFQHALRLNPLFRPHTKEKFLGLAYIQSNQDDRAIEALNRALAVAPNDDFANLALTAALALDGQMPEAEESLQRYVQSTGKDLPQISSLRKSLGWMGPNVERMFDGLRATGLSDG